MFKVFILFVQVIYLHRKKTEEKAFCLKWIFSFTWYFLNL